MRLILVVIFPALVALALIRLDYLPALDTYGVSVGTSNHYCSADVVHGHLVLGCERAE